MASGKTLNAKNLAALGAERLAVLLIEVSTGNAGIKRRLRLAIAGEAGAGDAAQAIGKRLSSIARARGFVDWRKVRPLATDLAAQHGAIVELVAPTEPRTALDLMWRFVACANSVFDRTDDGSGRLGAVFEAALRDIAPIAQAARIAPERLADRAFDALDQDEHGVLDDLATILAPALGTAGLERLRTLVRDARGPQAIALPDAERQLLGWSPRGQLPADPDRHRRRRLSFLLGQIADALGDVDSYIAEIDPETRRIPAVAARIAGRLLAVGRRDEAWAAIEAASDAARHVPAREWDDARLAVLDALGRQDEAQRFRWDRFATSLDADHLRAHLRRLPDFDDFEAEQRAIAYARTFPDIVTALDFLIGWPALDAAASLVLARSAEIDGDRYDILSPAADALQATYPLAAMLLHRAMIDFTLTRARHSRYVHAAGHLIDAGRLAGSVEDLGDVLDHEAYEADLRAVHGRKTGFWTLFDAQ